MLNDKIINRIYRELPDFKGKQRMGRLMFKRQLEKAENLIVTGKHNLKYLLPNLRENIAYEIFINGIYESETVKFIISKIPDGGVYIDIGANIGSIAMPIVAQKKDITVMCIEAAPGVYQYLEKNCKLNGLNNFTLIPNAVSDVDDAILSFYSPKDQFGKGHLTTETNEENVKVATIRLDTLLKKYHMKSPDFIKVDIEGYEYYAFNSAGHLLETPTAPDILFEFEDWAEERASGVNVGDAQLFLLKKGYKLYILKKGKLKEIATPLLQGSSMIWATKKQI